MTCVFYFGFLQKQILTQELEYKLGIKGKHKQKSREVKQKKKKERNH